MNEETVKLPKMMLQGNPNRACSIDGCPGRYVGRGYCMRHYSRIIRRGKPDSDPESPGDNNPNADRPLDEQEWCRFKDVRGQGFPKREVAFELRRSMQVISDAWDYESFSQYERRHEIETGWPSIAKYNESAP